jgi:aminopeptidase
LPEIDRPELRPEFGKEAFSMLDPRVARLARVLVDYSTAVEKGDAVLVWSYSDLAKPLVVEICRQLIRKGAGQIITHIEFEEVREALLADASDEQLLTRNDLLIHLAERLDVSIRILAPGNTRLASGFDPARVAKLEASHGALRNYVYENTRMVVTLFPTAAAAQDAQMPLGEFEDFVFRAVDQDWTQVGSEQQRLKELLDQASEITIKGEDTDLSMSVRGRTFVNCDGKINMPDGEIFTGPVEDSVEGHISFGFPAIFPPMGGQQVEGVHLWFEGGRVSKATARKGEEYLLAMLDTDAGSRHVGELGLGNNFNIDRFVGSILFDEKIGGTVHLALGQGFAVTGSQNKSDLHWDLITDLRAGGEIYVDGTLVQQDGQWTV